MKLQTSKLCVNCETLYEGTESCPYCRSEVFIWLFRALGTTLEPNPEEMDDCQLPIKENRAPQPHVYRSGSPMISFGDTIMRCISLAEFRTACGRLGREMVRVLTFGMVQAYK